MLIAHLTSFSTAGRWSTDLFGRRRFAIDHYLDERASGASWRGIRIRIRNWHRPLETCMQLLLDAGLELRHFAEPAPHAGEPRYRRVPWFLIMEWQKRA